MREREPLCRSTKMDWQPFLRQLEVLKNANNANVVPPAEAAATDTRHIDKHYSSHNSLAVITTTIGTAKHTLKKCHPAEAAGTDYRPL